MLARDGRGTCAAPVALMSAAGADRSSVDAPGNFAETAQTIAFFDGTGALTPLDGCQATRRLPVIDDRDAGRHAGGVPRCDRGG